MFLQAAKSQKAAAISKDSPKGEAATSSSTQISESTKQMKIRYEITSIPQVSLL